MRTLLLTPWGSPHKVISWQDGITKVYQKKAIVVAEYDEEIRSPSTSMKMPAVIQATKATPSMKKAVKFSRINVYTRDKWQCAYCGKPGTLGSLTYDHVVPRSRGGLTNFNNVISACKPCNTRKGSRTPAQAGMTLRFLPHTPKTLPMTPVRMILRNIPAEWEPFCAAVG
jgi:5-methylcytosine-specific restriction endonuclease McrA